MDKRDLTPTLLKVLPFRSKGRRHGKTSHDEIVQKLGHYTFLAYRAHTRTDDEAVDLYRSVVWLRSSLFDEAERDALSVWTKFFMCTH